MRILPDPKSGACLQPIRKARGRRWFRSDSTLSWSTDADPVSEHISLTQAHLNPNARDVCHQDDIVLEFESALTSPQGIAVVGVAVGQHHDPGPSSMRIDYTWRRRRR